MARRRIKLKRGRKVAYELIGQKDKPDMYDLLHEIVGEHHDDLGSARIALAWNLAWKADVDGRVTLGKCKKASDLDREFAPYDFVIVLRKEFWTNPTVKDLQRRALLDHELCHAARAYDQNGEPKIDERGRPIWRMRKHDLEEFRAIATRYGCWKSDIEGFFTSLRQGERERQQALDLEDPKAAKRTPQPQPMASTVQ